MGRLRQIPPETGLLIALLAASAPSGSLIEIGTSAGYSTLCLPRGLNEMAPGTALAAFLPTVDRRRLIGGAGPSTQRVRY